ncbi:MAG: glucose-1-phosphate cytidylyltransferase [Rhodospirillaceae bacterium]|nr:glucose-1-phosphate cytidylyltransferase [Rhodospirillaceae bacterium]
MKVVILAGGFGTRLGEETALRPKPMIEIGGMPLLLHIMKIYGAQGFNDFVVCLGYLGYVIKEYFANYALHRSDVTYDFTAGTAEYFNRTAEPWRVTLVDTGLDTMTGGRLRRARAAIGEAPFMLTYGDGVADIDVKALVAHHRRHGKAATVTAVQPPGRFGVLELGAGDRVSAFREKPETEMGWINGGFFVLEPSVFDLVEGDATVWEREPLERLAARGDLVAYRHRGFWQPVDTLRDKRTLEALWNAGKAPWKVWG